MNQLGAADQRTMNLRSNLAIQYKAMGHPERIESLFARTGICQHLKPVEDYLRGQGAKVLDICRPWSSKCRTWVYFDNIVIDAEALKGRLHLADCVEVHSHRGTVDGAEHGLVCKTDFDGVMGIHPEMAGGAIPRIG